MPCRHLATAYPSCLDQAVDVRLLQDAPTLVGGPSGIMIGNSIATQFIKANNTPLGAALSCVMMLAITVTVCIFLAVIGKKRLKGADF